MPISGLLALLDDVASIADDVASLTVAAAARGSAVSHDVATLTGLAVKKSTGVVTDDMAVTAEQAVGIRREREIPVVLAVAKGSILNKALYLVPGALLLSAVAPWAITPILMAGGAWLCFEGVEKVAHKVLPSAPGEAHVVEEVAPIDPELFEQQRVRGAIRTDLVLSGEIIAISLGEVASAPFFVRVLALYGVAVVMTVGVYGVVGLLVKIDDLGELLVLRGGRAAIVGRWIVLAAPRLLHLISWVGTVAMMMVGGSLLLHGVHPLAALVEHALEGLPGVVGWAAWVAVDVAVGALAGLAAYGLVATGLPARAWQGLTRLGRGLAARLRKGARRGV